MKLPSLVEPSLHSTSQLQIFFFIWAVNLQHQLHWVTPPTSHSILDFLCRYQQCAYYRLFRDLYRLFPNSSGHHAEHICTLAIVFACPLWVVVIKSFFAIKITTSTVLLLPIDRWVVPCIFPAAKILLTCSSKSEFVPHQSIHFFKIIHC